MNIDHNVYFAMLKTSVAFLYTNLNNNRVLNNLQTIPDSDPID